MWGDEKITTTNLMEKNNIFPDYLPAWEQKMHKFQPSRRSEGIENN